MKKLLAVSLTIMILGTLGGCGKQDTQEPPKVEIDYDNSELYTQEDMDAAIQVIEAEFATWEGCELHSLAYGGDAASPTPVDNPYVIELLGRLGYPTVESLLTENDIFSRKF